MRSLLALSCLLSACLCVRARAEEQGPAYQASVAVGPAFFVSTGFGENRLGGSLTGSLGLRFDRHLSANLLFMLHDFHLGASAHEGRAGASYALAFAPHYYPLGQRTRVEPFFAPLVGVATTTVRIEGAHPVTQLRARGVAAGATLGLLFRLSDTYALGLSVRTVRSIVTHACIRSGPAQVSCDALDAEKARTFTAELTFRVSFPALTNAARSH